MVLTKLMMPVISMALVTSKLISSVVVAVPLDLTVRWGRHRMMNSHPFEVVETLDV